MWPWHGPCRYTMLSSSEPTVPQLLCVHSLLRRVVYPAIAYQWPSLLAPLFRLQSLVRVDTNISDEHSVSMFRAEIAESSVCLTCWYPRTRLNSITTTV